MLFVLTPFDWLTLHGLVTVVSVLIYVVTSHVMRQRRHPTAAIAWVFFIVLMPYVALPAYLTFGSRKRQRPARLHGSAAPRPAAAGESALGWVADTLVSLEQPPPSGYEALALHADGQAARQALLSVVEGARHSLDIATFILKDDALGTPLIDALCAKAVAGVRVRLLLDGMGSLMAGRPHLARFTRAGGRFTLFVPPLHSPLKGRINLRNHRKLVVADAGTERARLWCGGRNLAAEYFEGEAGVPPWRDLSFDLRGELVQQAQRQFEHDWAFASGQPLAAMPPAAAVSVSVSGAPDVAPASGPEGEGAAPLRAQWLASGPDQADDTVYALLLTAAYRASRRLCLVTPYFVPDPALLSALCLAARRGVAVDLLLPAQSNHRLSDLARARALRALVQAGGRVWLLPRMLHAKLVVVDDCVALAGSANLDSRSLFLNYELMVAFQTPSEVQRFADWFERERAPAQAYRAQAPGLLRDLLEGMLLWVGFEL